MSPTRFFPAALLWRHPRRTEGIEGTAADTTPKNVRNHYRALWEFAHGVSVPQTYPTVLQVALNNLCNFKCVYCTDQRDGNTVPRSKIDGQSWTDLLEVIPFADVIAFHGISEFFIDKNFFDLVERCRAAGTSLSLNTNGSVATPRHIEVLKDYPTYIDINFSIDAASGPTFTRIRGWDFERVLRNIRLYVEAFKGRAHGTTVSISFVILRSNVHEMVPFLHLAKDLGVHDVKFYRLHEYGSLAWQIQAPDGRPFDYRDECTDQFKAVYNQQVLATMSEAEQLGLRLEIPALYEAAEIASAPE
jgi:MoaA/NifB/PqqE/SkfB family radical SAM enzyme